MPYELSDQQKQQFEADGYLVIKSFFPQSQAQKLLNKSKELLKEFDLEGHPMTVFRGSGDESKKQFRRFLFLSAIPFVPPYHLSLVLILLDSNSIGDDYFLTSGDKIRFFFEPAAFDEEGSLNRPKEEAVNKIGHALAMLDPDFREFSFAEDVKSLVRSVGKYEDPKLIQSMVICKNRHVGGKVSSHDDQTFLYSNPSTAMGLWFALEDCTPENGCLSFVPGSHKINQLTKRLVRINGGEDGTSLVPVPGMEDAKTVDWDNKEGVEWVAAPCEAGDLVLIHGAVIHRSERNSSQKSRFIYTFHCIEGSAEWDELNWLQPTEAMPFPSLYSTPAVI